MITTLRLKNFKCFEEETIDLGALTLLSGLNGMGKSTVLQSLLALRQSYEQALLPTTGLALNGDLVQLGTAQDVLYQEAKSESIGIGLTLENSNYEHWTQFKYDQKTDVLAIEENKLKDDFFKQSLFGDNFHFLNAERVGPRVSYEMSDYMVRQHRQIGSFGQYTAHYLSIFGEEEVWNPLIHHPRAKGKQLKNQTEAWLREISPGTRIELKMHPGMDLVNLEYSFDRGLGTRNFRPTNVGFGITYALPILVAALTAKKDSILVLENPEAHLHPKGQSKLGELLALVANGGVQVLIETHSDHILNGLRVATKKGAIDPNKMSVQYFRYDPLTNKNQALKIKIDKNGRTDTWPEGFFDQWDKDLEELVLP